MYTCDSEFSGSYRLRASGLRRLGFGFIWCTRDVRLPCSILFMSA